MGIPERDPIIVAPTPTPFDDENRVNLDAMARNLDRWLDTPLSGFVLGTGIVEETHLAEDEKVAILERVANVAAGERLIIGGLDYPAPDDAMRLATRYAEAGADLIRVRIPRIQYSAQPNERRGMCETAGFQENQQSGV